MIQQPPPVDPETGELVEEIKRQREVEAHAEYERTRRDAKRKVEEEETQLRKIVSVRGDTLRPRPVRFLWRDRYPLGGISLLAGKGEVSKTTVFTCQAAWLTRGLMKGAYYGTPVNVAYVVNEDLLEETVVPRMLVHGADMSRVHFLAVNTPLGEDALRFPGDADRLRSFIRETGVVATFIDPLSATIGGKINDPGDMRRTYTEIAKIARDTLTSILGLAHTRKAGAADVVEALMGSVEQVNVSRSVHGIVMDPDDDGVRLLSCEKSNLSDRSKLPTMRFQLESVPVDCGDGEINWQPRVEWLEEVSERASDILGDALYGNSNSDECARWLFDYLMSQGGEASFQHIRDSAPKQMSTDMLKRARKKINVRSQREKNARPGTIWSLPS